MPNLQNDGSFEVKVISAVFKEDESLARREPGQEAAFIITLKLETADGLHAFFDLPFNTRVIQQGKMQGKTELQATEIKLSEIGVRDGYLLNLQKAIDDGIHCKVTMKWEEWTDKTTSQPKRALKAKYLNALPKAVDISKINLADKLAALSSPKVEPMTPPSRPAGQEVESNFFTEPVNVEPAPAETEVLSVNDDIPF